MAKIAFTALGEPMSKGSVVARVATYGDGEIVYRNGRPVVVKHDSTGHKGKTAAKGIATAALEARVAAGLGVSRGEALAVTLRFYTARAKGHYGTGRNEGLLKDSAPARPAKKPDVDKWVRHVLDAMTGVIYADDGQVVELLASKEYAEGNDPPRTEIEVAVMPQQTVGFVADASQLGLEELIAA